MKTVLSSTPLTCQSTLAALPLQSFQVDWTVPGCMVAEEFELQPDLPGVIVMQGSQMLGMLSQQQFLQQLKALGQNTTSTSVSLQRPVREWLQEIHRQPLQLPMSCRIIEAIAPLLHRPRELVHEPIVVVGPEDWRLLDSHTLLLAHLQISHWLRQALKASQIGSPAHDRSHPKQAHLEVESHYQQALQQAQALIKQQSQELTHYRTIVEHLKKQVSQWSDLLSQRGCIALLGWVEEIEHLSHHTDQLLNSGQGAVHELGLLHSAASLVERLSKQVKYLANQTSVLLSHPTSATEHFSHIAAELAKLGQQTLAANQQVKEGCQTLQHHVESLNHLAQSSVQVTGHLLHQVMYTAHSWAELVEQCQFQEVKDGITHPPSDSSLSPDRLSNPSHNPEQSVMMLTIAEQIQQTHQTLTEMQVPLLAIAHGPLLQRLGQNLRRYVASA